MQRNISEILATKLCHDMAASIGAIYNGVEFLEMEEHEVLKDNKAFALVSENARLATDKLRFFRYIYGWAETDGEVDNKMLESITKGFYQDSKVQVEWRNEEKGENYVQLRHKAAKLAMLLMYIGSALMIHGGSISITLKKLSRGKSIDIAGKAIKEVKLDQDVIDIINGIDVLPSVHNIPVKLATDIARELGVTIHFTQNTDNFEFKFELV
jgi:histidine phosphotransferase ChpT